MKKLFIYSRKIHRILVLIVLILSLLMGGTGIILKFPKIATDWMTFIDIPYLRYLHNQLSTYFSIVLIIMVLTGLWLYLYPWLARRKTTDQEQSK